jgi:hypothetical protein
MADYKFLTDEDVAAVLQGVIDEFLIPKFKELNMNASGKWIASLETERRGTNEGVIRGIDYSYYLVNGRGANKDQSLEGLRKWAVWAGNTFIKDWVQAKGLTANPIAVAMSIAKKGTTWKRKGGSDLLEVLETPEVQRYVAERIRGIITPRVAEEMRRNITEAFRNV